MTDTLRSTLTALSQQWRRIAQTYEDRRMRLNDDAFNRPTTADYEARCEVARACADELDAVLASLPPEEETPTMNPIADTLYRDIASVRSLVASRGWGTEADKPAMLARLDQWADLAMRLREAHPVAPPAPPTRETD